MQQKIPNLADPSFEPTDTQFAEITRDAARTVRFRKAMAARGVKILAMNLSAQEERRLMEAWERGEAIDR